MSECQAMYLGTRIVVLNLINVKLTDKCALSP